jgi:hypothetical protein
MLNATFAADNYIGRVLSSRGMHLLLHTQMGFVPLICNLPKIQLLRRSPYVISSMITAYLENLSLMVHRISPDAIVLLPNDGIPRTLTYKSLNRIRQNKIPLRELYMRYVANGIVLSNNAKSPHVSGITLLPGCVKLHNSPSIHLFTHVNALHYSLSLVKHPIYLNISVFHSATGYITMKISAWEK